MAHFAELDANNLVLRVIVINNEILRENVTSEVDGMIEIAPIEKESKGIDFLKGLYGADTNWKQTSYNGNFRGKYAGIGDTFDGTNFVAPVVVDTFVETPVEAPVVVETPVEVSNTDTSATVTISPAETTGTVTIEASNTGV